ncbi:MAG TPA: DUF3263 domain-containing protein [Streptosporangiaceae bacterium]|nr:DUF3263 domain-containing protein [Streptosporangiaceae bacterium]
MALQERDLRILDFERRVWRNQGTKELEIRERFAISATRYYQLLNELIDRPEAAEFDPLLVKRLRARRSKRARRRSVRPADPGERTPDA